MAKKDIKENLENELSKKHACYVLITCDHPDKEGQMKINMSYQGDQALASYLVDGAQAYLEEPANETIENSLTVTSKIKS